MCTKNSFAIVNDESFSTLLYFRIYCDKVECVCIIATFHSIISLSVINKFNFISFDQIMFLVNKISLSELAIKYSFECHS